MNTHKYLSLIFLVIFSACSSFSQTAQVVSSSETIIKPTATILSFTPTHEATKTLTPISLATLQRPTPTLPPDWEGIPVISGAFKGKGEKGHWCVYWINMPIDEVEKFYMEELEASGLTLRAHLKDYNSGTTAYGGIDPVFIEFENKDTNEVSQVIIAIFPEDNSTIVTLAKYRLGP